MKSKQQQPDQVFNSKEVSSIAQVSPRQLQWWDERRVISPKKAGHRRLYEVEDVIDICVIAELRRKGFSLKKIRRVLRYARREIGRRLNDSGELYLLTDGQCHVLFVSESQQVIKFMQESKSGTYLVSIGDLLRNIQSSLKMPIGRRFPQPRSVGSEIPRSRSEAV
jgi:DNA-binding transcriptional MerR regulator